MTWKIGVAIGAAVFLVIFIFTLWRKKRSKMKQDREQMDRKVREEALDRALSNRLHHDVSTQSQTPFEVRYSGKQQSTKDTEMIRLTDQSETITREYLVRRESVVYLGEELGHSAVFQQKDGHQTIYCELFPNDGQVYIRSCRKGTCGFLLRGRKRAELNNRGIQVADGDRIEIRSGTFLVELI